MQNECGRANEKKLRDAELLAQSRNTWAQAEDQFRDLCQNNPNWVEPRNRLATLLFLKGQVEDSRVLCEDVLRKKPCTLRPNPSFENRATPNR
jgi:hypothetical protein